MSAGRDPLGVPRRLAIREDFRGIGACTWFCVKRKGERKRKARKALVSGLCFGVSPPDGIMIHQNCREILNRP